MRIRLGRRCAVNAVFHCMCGLIASTRTSGSSTRRLPPTSPTQTFNDATRQPPLDLREQDHPRPWQYDAQACKDKPRASTLQQIDLKRPHAPKRHIVSDKYVIDAVLLPSFGEPFHENKDEQQPRAVDATSKSTRAAPSYPCCPRAAGTLASSHPRPSSSAREVPDMSTNQAERCKT